MSIYIIAEVESIGFFFLQVWIKNLFLILNDPYIKLDSMYAYLTEFIFFPL